MGWILLLSNRTFWVTLEIPMSQDFLCVDFMFMSYVTENCFLFSIYLLSSQHVNFSFSISVFPYLAPSPLSQLVDEELQGPSSALPWTQILPLKVRNCWFRYSSGDFVMLENHIILWLSLSMKSKTLSLGKFLKVCFIIMAVYTYTFIFHISDFSSLDSFMSVSKKRM